MIKKFWFSLLFLFTILFVWNALADLLPPPTIPEEICIMFESVKIGNWRIISINKNWGKVTEEQEKQCISYYDSVEFYILDYNIDVHDLSLNNIEDKADKVMRLQWPRWKIIGPRPTRHEYIYKVILNWSWLYETQLIEENRINIWKENFQESHVVLKKTILSHHRTIEKIRVFGMARLITILVETVILFLISKFCWKTWSFKNRKLIFTWVLASTVTLPLLRFVLSIFFSNYRIYVIFWEVLVTVIETFIIKYLLKIERQMAIFASVICNLSSFLIWLFIF